MPPNQMPPNQMPNPYQPGPPAGGPMPPPQMYGPPPVAPPPQQPTPQGKQKGKNKKDGKDERMSTQKYLMFSEIKDGIVVMRDGSLRMVIMASALNIDLKSQQEQDAIEFAYQGF